MKSKLSIFMAALLFSNFATAHVWVSATPTSVRLVDGGLVVNGNFDFSNIPCATSSKAIFLDGSDSQFDQKLSMALMALAAGKEIEVLIYGPTDESCKAVSAQGTIPIAFHNYWIVK